jgi:two-component system, chemotaxis family, protein-glutamate methylesterase/glutaminase
MENKNKKINVMVVDDSSFMRRIIIDMLNEHPDIHVCGIAINGRMALSQLEKLQPDVITLDVEMPFLNGLETLKEITRIKPTPTVMLSSLTGAGAEITIQALELGAFDFIKKPETDSQADMESLRNDLISKVLAAGNAQKHKVVHTQFSEKSYTRPHTTTGAKRATRVKTVVIASSTGGPQALKEVIPYIPKDLPAQILVVQHMPPKFTDMFAQRLDKISSFKVKEAQEGDILEAQQVLIAPGNFHMLVEAPNKIVLNQAPQVCGVRPAADITFASAAKIFKEDLICVVLTGMGHDGTFGSKIVKSFGGYCIAEDKSTSIIYGMPKSVIDAGYADEIQPLDKITKAIVEAVYK